MDWFNMLKGFYERNFWTKEQVKQAVEKNKITSDEYQKIANEEYQV
ncbi:XkdX family protein [Priestia megaterium]|nr:XkdX family protein [Priestia megaterium]MCR8865042.1 XkdX family protein [Priestia megaterium]